MLDLPFAPGEIREYTFFNDVPNLGNLVNLGQYMFRVAVTFVGDINNLPDCNAFNDTLYTIVENGGLPHVYPSTISSNEPDSGIVFDAGEFAGYLWSTGENTQTITVYELGDYGVTVTDEFGCVTSGVFHLVETGEIANPASHLYIYPNPNHGEFNLKFTSPEVSNLKLEILNIEGIKIYEQNFASTKNINQPFNMSKLAKGVYYIKAVSDTKTLIKKFVIE